MEPNPSVHHHSDPAAKIALFRSLFRGRDDVYARWFVNLKTGKAGYAPACANESAQGICDKPRIKCALCPHQRFFPVADDVVRRHLAGRDDDGVEFVMGMYPMLRDESSYLLVIDLDKANWPAHARAILETCLNLHMAAALERSRSGQSGRLWFFFNEAIPAVLAQVCFPCFDRKHGTLPGNRSRFVRPVRSGPEHASSGRFRQCDRLAAAKAPRQIGNSVFLDDDMVPFRDQWAFLSTIPRIKRSEIEPLIRSAEAKRRVIGASSSLFDAEDVVNGSPPSSPRLPAGLPSGPLPRTLDLILGNEIRIEKEPLPPALLNRLIRLAAFPNPEFDKAQAMRLSTHGRPRFVSCARDYPHHIGLPRGCLDEVVHVLSELKVTLHVRDERFAGRPLDAPFRGTLRPDQQAAAEAMLAHDIGVLSATTAFGKTVIGAWLIAQRGVNTLVLVHRRQLQEQWIERLTAFLGMPARAIGRVGGGKRKPTGAVDVAVIQSLARRGIVKESVRHYGHLIVDECHHLSARTFEQVAREVQARFVTGLSATVTRKDGRHPIILMQCGPVRHRVDARAQAAARPFEHTVTIRPTGCRPVMDRNLDLRVRFRDLYNNLIADEQRNRLICADVVQAVRDGRSPIVLTERKDHLDALAGRIAPKRAICSFCEAG